MVWGIAIQAIAITVAVLGAFRIGLAWFPEQIDHARTMAFATLSISELLRAYTARSERHNIWQIGIFANRFLQYGVLASLAIQLLIIYLPALDPVFNTTALQARDWLVIVPLILLPAAVAEVSKMVLRRSERVHRVTNPAH
jgi:Ca2+-transporting ATPase